jgi:CAAX protease family protein
MQTFFATYIRGLSRAAEIVIVVAIFAGWFIYASVQAVLLGFPVPTFEDRGLLGLVILETIMFGFAWSFLRVRGWRIAQFDIRVTWLGLLIGSILYGVGWIADVAIWDSFAKQDAARSMLEDISHANTATLPMVLLVSIINGTYEEFFLTGYLLKALRSAGASAALGVSALIRLTCHLYQGPIGALMIMTVGLLFAGFYWRYRLLWPVICAHIIADVLGLAR